MCKITVFTPTYNRGGFLRDIFDCLCRQSCKDFEWIIVDDGSSDDTKTVVDNIFSMPRNFPIRYFYKKNGGKHTAINVGVKNADGELFLILDSDDSLPDDAVSTLLSEFKKVSATASICGICGLMAHRSGKLISGKYPEDGLIADSIELRYKYNIIGDLIEVFKTSVLKEFPFPEIGGERFCPEALVWNRIARKYKLYCFNKVVYLRDYLDGGLTSNIVKIRMNSPISSATCYAELNRLPIPFVSKVKSAINYWRFRLCANSTHLIPNISRVWYAVLPLSYLMHFKDARLIKSNS